MNFDKGATIGVNAAGKLVWRLVLETAQGCYHDCETVRLPDGFTVVHEHPPSDCLGGQIVAEAPFSVADADELHSIAYLGAV